MQFFEVIGVLSFQEMQETTLVHFSFEGLGT